MSNWFPKNVSTFGGEIDSVFYLIFYIVGFWFLLTEGIILYSIIRHRHRKDRRASFIQGEKWAEFAWVLVPAAIVLILDLGIDFAGGKVWARIKGEAPAGDVQVQVTGKQFNWIITYPGPDGAFGTTDDLTEMNELHVPVGKVVRVILKAEDVIHSFFVPTLRLKQDCLPGRNIPIWFEVTEPGKYEIACAELCGFGHYTMRGFLVVHTDEEYTQWMEEHWSSF
jgi:cytochrome c oxidase subunit 2